MKAAWLVSRIPAAWEMNPSGAGDRYLEITGYDPNGCRGYVTVDWLTRTYRLGLSTSGRPSNTKTYTGRGYRQTLVDDAVAALRAATT